MIIFNVDSVVIGQQKYKKYRVVMMMYNTQEYQVFGHCMSGILKNVLETGSISALR